MSDENPSAAAPAWFEQSKQRLNAIAAAYNKRCDEFERQLAELSRIFAGTDVARYLDLLNEHVGDAYENNQQAGWLPSSPSTFSDMECFETLIRHDRSGRRFKSLSDVPTFLRAEYEGWAEDEFQTHAEELREASREGYDGLAESREIMDDEPDCEELFDGLYNWPDHAGASTREIAQAEALVNNLHGGWKRCQEAGLALLHPANHENPDYDPTLMEALMGE